MAPKIIAAVAPLLLALNVPIANTAAAETSHGHCQLNDLARDGGGCLGISPQALQRLGASRSA